MGLLGFIEEGVHHESVSMIAWDCWSDGACTSRVQVCEMGRAQARLLNRLNTLNTLLDDLAYFDRVGTDVFFALRREHARLVDLELGGEEH